MLAALNDAQQFAREAAVNRYFGLATLGVCGDFLGSTGVEGAWQSAQALIESVLCDVPTAAAPAVADA